METYWRCPDCLRIESKPPLDKGVSCRTGQPLEPVAVLPVAELAALRAREIDWERYNALDSEVQRLRLIEARLRDDTLAKEYRTPCSWHAGMTTFNEDAYRRAVLGEGKEARDEA